MPATVTGQSKNSNASLTGVAKGGLIDEADDFLLKEDGDFLLLEVGDKILLDRQNFSTSSKPGNATVTGITKT